MSNMSEDKITDPPDKDYVASTEMLEIAERYIDGEKVPDLAKEYDIPKSTIYNRFRRMNISTRGTEGSSKKALSTVRKVETEALAAEAEKLATIAIKLGGVIARRYMAIIDHLMSQDKSLELIAEEIMSWYEDKRSVLKNVERLEATQELLSEQLELAYGRSLPNFKYELRTRILTKYANQVLKARAVGVRLPMKRLVRAYHTELVTLENRIEDITIVDNEEMMIIG